MTTVSILICVIALHSIVSVSSFTHNGHRGVKLHRLSNKSIGELYDTKAVSSSSSSSNNEINEELYVAFEGNSPGEVRALPVSHSDRSRRELAKVVVSCAILWLTVTLKVQELYNQYGKGKDSSKTLTSGDGLEETATLEAATISAAIASVDEQGMIELSNGIKYQDILIGDNMANRVDNKSIYTLKLRLLYHGVEILQDGDIVKEYQLVLNSQSNQLRYNTVSLPVKGLYQSIDGLTIGGVRKIILPSKEAFGSSGYPPFIPADTAVMYIAEIV